MAYLVNSLSNAVFYLSGIHYFGRSKYSTSDLTGTNLFSYEISKNHAVIEWQDCRWMLKDISKNGTWLNGKKLKPNERQKLSYGDVIHLVGDQKVGLCVKNLDPPCNMLTPTDQSSLKVEPVPLDNYSILPTDREAEIAIYLDPRTQNWYQLDMNNSVNQSPKLISENDIIHFSNTDWQLKLIDEQELTVDTGYSPIDVCQLEYIFKLSQDEETTEIEVNTPTDQVMLNSFTHHYLTLTLARYRASDAEKGLNSENQGWVYVDQLAKDLGINNVHLNIQIHRARKQFSSAFNSTIDTNFLIQRRPGKIRFGGEHMTLYKGGQLECSLEPRTRVKKRFM